MSSNTSYGKEEVVNKLSELTSGFLQRVIPFVKSPAELVEQRDSTIAKLTADVESLDSKIAKLNRAAESQEALELLGMDKDELESMVELLTIKRDSVIVPAPLSAEDAEKMSADLLNDKVRAFSETAFVYVGLTEIVAPVKVDGAKTRASAMDLKIVNGDLVADGNMVPGFVCKDDLIVVPNHNGIAVFGQIVNGSFVVTKTVEEKWGSASGLMQLYDPKWQGVNFTPLTNSGVKKGRILEQAEVDALFV